MYRVRPYFEIKKIRLPDCMYPLKALHQLPSVSPPSQEVGSPSRVSVCTLVCTRAVCVCMCCVVCVCVCCVWCVCVVCVCVCVCSQCASGVRD